MNGLNMLNTKYIIYNKDAEPLRNPFAYGNAWFVDNVKIVENADEEILELPHINPSNTAIVDKRYENILKDYKGGKDATATIKLVSYKANQLEYIAKNLKNHNLAVFSEIYYEKGWNAYVDGKLTPHFRTDYVLRGMILPPGDHTIVFKFEPEIFYKAEKISYAGSTIFCLVILGAVCVELYRKRKK
jgi:uncharacterized membrane protein YfhO